MSRAVWIEDVQLVLLQFFTHEILVGKETLSHFVHDLNKKAG